MAVLAVLLLAAVVGGIFLLLNDPDEPAATGGADPTQDSSATAGDDQEEAPASPEESDEPAPSDEPSEEEPSGEGTEQFVADYYAALPGDPETGWSRLSPGFQDQVGSYDDYAAFWATIDDVTADETKAVDDDAVEVTLTYTTDGNSQTEVRRIELTPEGQGYLISGDQVVG